MLVPTKGQHVRSSNVDGSDQLSNVTVGHSIAMFVLFECIVEQHVRFEPIVIRIVNVQRFLNGSPRMLIGVHSIQRRIDCREPRRIEVEPT